MTPESGMSTSRFNPLAHPVCLSYPLRLASTAWAAHIPFGMFLIDVLRPRVVVELGTFSGVSYCAFCQAVAELKIDTRCWALDTWRGDRHAGTYGEEVLTDLRRHHDSLYQDFSELIQTTFDGGLDNFANGTIDLLHIDGHHTYESVKHDFDTWLPKLSERGVVLLHDINVRERDFGVWKLWAEIKDNYPHFEFPHEHGLGVLLIGGIEPPGLAPLLHSSESEAAMIRQFFSQMGLRLRVRLEKDLETAAKEELASELNISRETIGALSTELTNRSNLLTAKEDQLAVKEAQLNNILSSRAWKWVTRYGRFKNWLRQSLRSN